MLKVVTILLLVCSDVVVSLICETCDGSTCFDKDRWVQELCPPSTQFCYRLSSEGRAFRRGCADFPCSKLPGVEPEMECRTCNQDRCNNERDGFFHQHGTGVSWRSSSNYNFSAMFTSVFICVAVVFGFN